MLDLPTGVRTYVLGLPALAVAVASWLLVHADLDIRDVGVFALLLAGGALSVETTRRVGQPAGTAVKDFLSVWWLPMAVLLPPVYVLLAPIPLLALTQWRVRPSPVHRRVFSAASIGLPYAGASFLFHTATSNAVGPPLGPGLLGWAVLVAAVGAVATVANILLIVIAVKLVDAEARWSRLLGDAEALRMETVEMCVGVTIAVLVGVEPALVVFMLPPVLMLQRGLLHAHLRAIALLDSKTGLLNPQSWEREAGGKLLALRRRGQPAALLLIDIDHFKRVNDTHGHLVGDEVLQAVADVLKAGMRDGDLLGRFGGEEFVVLLPAADAVVTSHVAERLRDQVARLVVPLPDGSGIAVTVSIGVAVTRSSDLPVPDLLAAADYCMYRAKAAGRNQVVLSE